LHTTHACAPGESEDACATDAASALAEYETWTSWKGPSGTAAQPILYTHTRTSTTAAGAAPFSDLRTYTICAEQTGCAVSGYRILETQDEVDLSGILPLPIARTATLYDA